MDWTHPVWLRSGSRSAVKKFIDAFNRNRAPVPTKYVSGHLINGTLDHINIAPMGGVLTYPYKVSHAGATTIALPPGPLMVLLLWTGQRAALSRGLCWNYRLAYHAPVPHDGVS